jgi:hypothetical protein
MPTQDISMPRTRIEPTTPVFCITLSDTDESSYCVQSSNNFKNPLLPSLRLPIHTSQQWRTLQLQHSNATFVRGMLHVGHVAFSNYDYILWDLNFIYNCWVTLQTQSEDKRRIVLGKFLISRNTERGSWESTYQPKPIYLRPDYGKRSKWELHGNPLNHTVL